MNKTEEVSLSELLKKIKKHLIEIIIISILIGGIIFCVSKFIVEPSYVSNTTMIVGNSTQVSEDKGENLDYSQIQANRALVPTYSEIVKSKGVANKVIENLDLNIDYEEFAGKVSIEPVNDTQIISVKVVDTVPERAMDIANETSMIFKDSITDIMNVDNVQILDKAVLPDEPSSPNVLRNTFIGLILGFVLGLAVALFKELSDTSIKSADDIKENFDIPVLGVLPDKKK